MSPLGFCQMEEEVAPVTIGSYPIRAKSQVLRLLCEYVHLPYSDHFFNPDSWEKFKGLEASNWTVKDVPFLRHAQFVVTGHHAMITYVVDLSQRGDLLGASLEDKMKIDRYRFRGNLMDLILNFLVNTRETTNEEKAEKRRLLNELYEKKIHKILSHQEEECMERNYYCGYLTVIDFTVYEVINYIRLLFPQELSKFPKLCHVRERVGNIAQVWAYEHSDRAVKQYCPIRYFKKYKKEMWKLKQKLKALDQDDKCYLSLKM